MGSVSGRSGRRTNESPEQRESRIEESRNEVSASVQSG